MGDFYTDVIENDARFHSTEVINDLNLLEPVTKQLAQAILADAQAQGIDVMIFETYRSQERQTQLYNQGRTKLKVVGTHHYGLACDIVCVVNNQPSWKGDFTFLGELAHAHGLIWGGDWGNPDIPHTFIDQYHVQRCSIARQGALFRGEWYPDESYNPYQDNALSLTLTVTGFNWNDSDLKAQFNRVESNGWLDFFNEAATNYGWATETLLGIASRESNIQTVLGDFGHGHGIMQIDDRSFPAFCNSDAWKDARQNILFGANVLSGKRKYLSNNGIQEPMLMRASIAAYNCGEGNARKALAQGRDVDFYTANRNYSYT